MQKTAVGFPPAVNLSLSLSLFFLVITRFSKSKALILDYGFKLGGFTTTKQFTFDILLGDSFLSFHRHAAQHSPPCCYANYKRQRERDFDWFHVQAREASWQIIDRPIATEGKPNLCCTAQGYYMPLYFYSGALGTASWIDPSLLSLLLAAKCEKNNATAVVT